MSKLQERVEAMDKLRSDLKKSRWAYKNIASISGNSTGWIGQCLRGNYPYRGGYHLPHRLADALVDLGFKDATFLKIDYTPPREILAELQND